MAPSATVYWLMKQCKFMIVGPLLGKKFSYSWSLDSWALIAREMTVCLRVWRKGTGFAVSSVSSVDVYSRVINSMLSYCSPVIPPTQCSVLSSHFGQGSADLRCMRQFFKGRETNPLKLFKAQTLWGDVIL